MVPPKTSLFPTTACDGAWNCAPKSFRPFSSSRGGPPSAESSLPARKSPAPKQGGNDSRSGLPALSSAQEATVFAHRQAVANILRAVENVDHVSEVDVGLLRSQIDRLDDGLFLLVVVGEYNSGKSSCINALLGRHVLAEGVIPTTGEVTVLRYAHDPSSAPTPATSPEGVVVLSQNVDMLKTVSLVDSPGTNAIDRRHEALTKEYLPLCDLVLFVTSADRPFSESERQFLSSIRAWGKKAVLLINKTDLLPDGDAKREVVNFVKASSRVLLGNSPKVFTVSSRQAMEAKLSATGRSGPHWDASGFEALESYISDSLDADERLGIKLESVASVASTVGMQYVDRLAMESAVIEADCDSLDNVTDSLKRCEASIERGFPAHYARVDNALLELLERADAFFDANVSIGNIRMLVKTDAVSKAFMNDVVQGTEREVERRARSLAEWVSEKLARNIADVSSAFSRRVGERNTELLMAAREHRERQQESGAVGGGAADALLAQFTKQPTDLDVGTSTDSLLSGLGEAAAKLAASYDPEVEGKRVADALSSSVRTTIALELGALGVLGAALGTSMIDVTSITSTSLLLTSGLFILPRRRQLLRADLRSRIASIRARLEKEMHSRVKDQMGTHAERVQSAIEPFSSRTTARAASTSAQSLALTQALEGVTAVRSVTIATALTAAASSTAAATAAAAATTSASEVEELKHEAKKSVMQKK